MKFLLLILIFLSSVSAKEIVFSPDLIGKIDDNIYKANYDDFYFETEWVTPCVSYESFKKCTQTIYFYSNDNDFSDFGFQSNFAEKMKISEHFESNVIKVVYEFYYPHEKSEKWNLTFVRKGIKYIVDPNINSCSNINSAGEWFLTSNILNSNGRSCMNITSNNVIFDCQSYNIDMGGLIGPPLPIAINVSRPSNQNVNITIKNCNLTDWTQSIFLSKSSNITLMNITLGNSTNYCVYFLESENITVLNVTIHSCIDRGMFFLKSNNTNVDNVKIINSKYGLYFQNSERNIIKNLNVLGNQTTSSSIAHILYSNNNKIENSAFSKTVFGFYVDSSIGNIIYNVTSINNTYGYYIFGGSGTLINNTFSTNNTYGFFIDNDHVYIDRSNITGNVNGIYTTTYLTLTNSIIQDNINAGLNVSSSVFSGYVVAYNNLFNNSVNVFFDPVSYIGNKWNFTKSLGERIYGQGQYIGGNYWTNSTNNDFSDTCSDDDKDGICDSEYTFYTSNTDFLPLSNKGEQDCSPSSGDWYINSNVNCMCNSTWSVSGNLYLYGNLSMFSSCRLNFTQTNQRIFVYPNANMFIFKGARIN
ncbi:MAG: NosD domain-containing protein [Candidatus Aenigmatarchaeota archaeon]